MQHNREKLLKLAAGVGDFGDMEKVCSTVQFIREGKSSILLHVTSHSEIDTSQLARWLRVEKTTGK